MTCISRLVMLLLVTIIAITMAAPKQMVFGFGKRSIDSLDEDLVRDIPIKRYKTKNFAMGFGKRGSARNFNMGFGKRSMGPVVSEEDLGLPLEKAIRSLRSVKDETRWGRKFSMGLGKRSVGGESAWDESIYIGNEE